jgi:GR25 family glycosyltransferase involved in LPS biosynthesis
MLKAFQDFGPPEATHPNDGAVKAWLAHIDILKFVIQNDYETALIVEDDIDWDVDIKKQTVLLAEAVRNFTKTPPEVTAPYGLAWDILWIGNCGDEWEPDWETVLYDDGRVISHDKYTGWAKGYVERLPENRRAVYTSSRPICTHAFAVTREGAKKLLDYVVDGQNEAYDVKLMQGCNDKKVNCITVTPEIMHEYRAPDVTGWVEKTNGKEDTKNREDDDINYHMGFTENILNSARCYTLFRSTCLKR